MRRANIQESRKIAGTLTLRYVLTLFALAVLAVGGHLVQDRIITKTNNDAALVNISGRQRMLLQQVYELSVELGRSHDYAITEQIGKELRSDIDRMEKSHNTMVYGDPKIGINEPMSAIIRPYYFGPDGFLDHEVRKFIIHARNLLNNEKSLHNPDNPDNPNLSYISKEALGNLKSSLNAAVDRYQAENDKHLNEMKDQSRYILLATMLMLVFSALIVFHPMVKRVEHELNRHELTQESLNQANAALSERADRLAHANEMLSDFAHVVSHDLKTPLRAVHNYSDFLREDLDGTLDEEQQSYLSGMIKAVAEADLLIDDMLDYSRVSSNDIPSETIDVGEFIRGMVESLSATDEIRFSDQCPGKCIMLTEASPILFKQIIQNLISNALKYNNSKNKRVEIGCRPAGDDIGEIFVKDNGIGIDKKYFNKIFNIFQRLHTKDEYNGTGIGLAIVKKAVERIGGTIRVESKPGKGSTFYISLPIKSINEKEA